MVLDSRRAAAAHDNDINAEALLRMHDWANGLGWCHSGQYGTVETATAAAATLKTKTKTKMKMKMKMKMKKKMKMKMKMMEVTELLDRVVTVDKVAMAMEGVLVARATRTKRIEI